MANGLDLHPSGIKIDSKGKTKINKRLYFDSEFANARLEQTQKVQNLLSYQTAHRKPSRKVTREMQSHNPALTIADREFNARQRYVTINTKYGKKGPDGKPIAVYSIKDAVRDATKFPLENRSEWMNRARVQFDPEYSTGKRIQKKKGE